MKARRQVFRASFFALLLAVALQAAEPQGRVVIWRIDDPRRVGEHAPRVLGAPQGAVEDERRALVFNGASDGLVVAENVLRGWKAFTIEVLFKPAGDGPEAQRFVHLEDVGENRALIETRLTSAREWYLDTFLFAKPRERGLTLVDPAKRHPCDRWYWAALVYDGVKMAHFVDGVKEREGAIEFGPMREGRTSVGVRLNQVYWFKGAIAELRFHPEALGPARLQRAR